MNRDKSRLRSLHYGDTAGRSSCQSAVVISITTTNALTPQTPRHFTTVTITSSSCSSSSSRLAAARMMMMTTMRHWAGVDSDAPTLPRRRHLPTAVVVPVSATTTLTSSVTSPPRRCRRGGVGRMSTRVVVTVSLCVTARVTVTSAVSVSRGRRDHCRRSLYLAAAFTDRSRRHSYCHHSTAADRERGFIKIS